MNDLISNKIQIETETVSSKDGKRTFSITRRIVGMDESRAVMVMLYPTRSALKMNVDDSTFFHLTQHLPEMGISELTSSICSQKESVISKQIIRSGTSIGANANEAAYGVSQADFISKMQIALKETAETEYWLKLLLLSDYLDEKLAQSLINDCLEFVSSSP